MRALFQTAITSLVSSAVIVGIITFSVRQIFKQLLARDIERFKIELQSQHAIESEKLRAELAAVAAERRTTFGQVYRRRFEVIERLYELLALAHEDFRSLASPFGFSGGPSEAEKLKKTAESGKAFIPYFDQKRLFLNESLCQQIEKIHGEFHKIWIDFIVYGSDPELRKDKMRAWKDAWEKMEKEIPDIRSAIETEMRIALRVQ